MAPQTLLWAVCPSGPSGEEGGRSCPKEQSHRLQFLSTPGRSRKGEGWLQRMAGGLVLTAHSFSGSRPFVVSSWGGGGNRFRQREQGQVLKQHPGSSARLVGTGGVAVSPPQWGLLCAGLAGPRTSGGGWADHIPVPVHLLKTQDPKGNHTLSFQTWPGIPEPSGCSIIKLHQSTL